MKNLEIWKEEIEKKLERSNQADTISLHSILELGGGGGKLGNFSLAYPKICSL